MRSYQKRAKAVELVWFLKIAIMEKETLKQSLGIDVAKDSLSFCLGTLAHDLEKDFTSPEEVPNSPKGFKQLLEWIEKQTVGNHDPLVVMEATGVYHEAIAAFLYQNGFDVSIMQSGRVKRYAQSLDQRSKTDALDSRMLAMLGCERRLPLWAPPDKNLRKLKALSRERSFLLKEKQVEKNRLHAREASAYGEQGENRRYEKRMELIEEQIAEIELEMKALIEKDDLLNKKIKYVTSIPGISFISAATVIGETLGFDAMNSAKQLTSYAGYDVVLKESGTYKGKTRISKKGNKHIRAVLHMPSMTAVRVNPTLKPFYERLKPKKAKPKVALVAVQRKLLILIYTLYKNENFYDAEYEQKKAARIKVPAAQDRSNIELTPS